MKPIVVGDQVRLGAARCFALSVSGMSYRVFRSMVTVAILALAVAFLTHIVSFGLIEHQTLSRVQQELRDSRLLGEWVNRLTDVEAEATAEKGLSTGQTAKLSEYKTWSGLSDEAFAKACTTAGQLEQVYGYFDSLPVTAQAILTAGLKSREVLVRLQNRERFSEFTRHLDELKLDAPIGGRKAFVKLLHEDLPELRTTVSAIRSGHRRAIESIRRTFPGKSALRLLAESPEGLADALAEAGFVLSGPVLEQLARAAQARERFNWVAEAINLPQANAEIAKELGIERTSVNVTGVLTLTNSRKKVRWLSELLARHAGEQGVSAEELLSLGAHQRRLGQLQEAAGDKPEVTGSGFSAIPRWVRWLIALSFLVCTVGVANAMFMSVTERFTEIATMKCLGALDGFLMLLFLFESSTQGLVGAGVGVVLGIGLAMLRGLIGYGLLMSLPLQDLLIGAGLCLVSGVILAVVGGVGPAWAAARLAPMEAMRIE